MQTLYIPFLSDYPMILTLLGLIFGGLLTLLVGTKSEKGARALAALSLLGGLVLNVLLLLRVGVTTVFHDIVWLGDETDPIMTLGFLGDGLSAPVALLILGLGLFSVVYSFYYMENLKHPGLYYSLMVWFVASMVGVVYATNLMQFFIFYELMLIPAFVLVYVYGVSEDPEQRSKNALQFWVWTAIGGMISLFATFFLFGATGTMDIQALYSASIATSVAKLIGVMFLLGFGIKLGLVPLHVWAPPVYGEAPIPVLVLLSGAMTKTAAYGVIRIVIPIFRAVLADYSLGLMVISVVTMFYGAMLAIAQKDLKMMLAYSSISQLGYLMFGYSTMTLVGVNGAAFQLINHGILASLMFFCAGAIKMKAGTMEFDKLGGLAPKMPALATVFVLGGIALAGTPPMSAFVGEFMIFMGAASLASNGWAYVAVLVVGVIATGLTAAYYLWAIRRTMYGPIPEGLEQVNDPPLAIIAIVGIMAFFVVVLGIWPSLLWSYVQPVLLAIVGGG
ncbi:MAG: NADH-quinone oxidoreductase subunit M [Candidatus Thorarchaeota archaeon]|nr:NADH-quinone oxidoreductase subunit M [Candidatus Thorarchaeota archaeon]